MPGEWLAGTGHMDTHTHDPPTGESRRKWASYDNGDI
jgi:hypothetical protein